ncbi:MAG: hypothetical protein WBB07_11035 [Mycobacterium sp.]
MLIAGVVCLFAALATAGSGVWTLTRPRSADLTQQVLRAVAPVQLAAAVMLAAGGVVALAAPAPIALVVLIVCVLGALGTLAAGCWQGARFATRPQPPAADCTSSCGSCTLSCGTGAALVAADVDRVSRQQ